MKNERGLTLVELLAVLAIIGIIGASITGVIVSGMKASERNSTNQRLQQEANIIIETIRTEYLKLEGDDIKLEIDNENETLKMDGKVISEGYKYDVVPDVLFRDRSREITLTIKKNDHEYETKTTFSKLR